MEIEITAFCNATEHKEGMKGDTELAKFIEVPEIIEGKMVVNPECIFQMQINKGVFETGKAYKVTINVDEIK